MDQNGHTLRLCMEQTRGAFFGCQPGPFKKALAKAVCLYSPNRREGAFSRKPGRSGYAVP